MGSLSIDSITLEVDFSTAVAQGASSNDCEKAVLDTLDVADGAFKGFKRINEDRIKVEFLAGDVSADKIALSIMFSLNRLTVPTVTKRIGALDKVYTNGTSPDQNHTKGYFDVKIH